MPLKLIHGPPNSGRADRIQALFRAALDRDPVLVLPTLDDVFRFERSLCADGAALGGSVLTFADLFREVAWACGAPAGSELTPAQRLAAVSAGIAAQRGGLGPLRRSAARPGFAIPFERLLDELQAAGLEPAALESGAQTLESSAYLGDLTALFAAYAEVRDGLGMRDVHGLAAAAIEALRAAPDAWGERPVFLYEPGEPTGNQRRLLAALREATEVTVAFAYEEDNPALAARASLMTTLSELAEESEAMSGPAEPAPFGIDPLLVHLQRELGRPEPARRPPGDALVLLRSAGERSEAEAIGAQAAELIDAGADPAAIAIAVRDPARRGPLLADVLESYGIAVALEAEVPVATTSVGGTLIALLEAELGAGRASDLLRFLRGPSGVSPARVDWFERATRRRRLRSAADALELWEERYERLPADLLTVREAAAAGPATLAGALARLAPTIASRPLRGEADGPEPRRGDGLELRAAAAIASALGDLAELPDLAPPPEGLIATLRELRFDAWSGPVEGRVRIASPYRLRASRFEHVFVASLQDGEFPRRERREDPFLAEAQRLQLGLDPRRDPEAEERYLFHACLALPSRRLFLSYRDSDEDGVAEARSPFLDEVRRLLDPAPPAEGEDPVEAELTIARDLTDVRLPRDLHPSPDRLERARRAEAASRAPGPIANPEVLAALSRRPGLRRHDAGGLRHLLLPLVRLPRARPATARPGARPARPGRADAPRAGAALRRAAGRRRPPPPRLARRLDGARPAACRGGVDRARARRPPGRAGDRAPGRGPAGALPRRRGGARAGRLRALAAGGALRRGRGRPSARRWRSTAGRCTAQSTGSTATRPAAPSSSTTSSRAASRRWPSSSSRRSCSCSST